MTLAKDVTGDTWSVHAKKKCVSPCPFHSPSDHALKDAPIHLRADKMMLVERMCEHGVGHDDPDSVAYFHSKGEMWAGTHGCDGCCTTEPMTLPDDIELREKLAKLEVYTTVKSEKHPLYYKDIEAILEFIATYRKKWETEARIDELNSISEPDKPGVYDPGAPEKPLTINERITELQGENK